MEHLSISTVLTVLGLMGTGGFIGWTINGYKLKSELMPRAECTKNREMCGVRSTKEITAIWQAVTGIETKIDRIGKQITDALVEIAKVSPR